MGRNTESRQVEIAADEEFLRVKRVLEKTGLSRPQLYREMQAGRFPKGHSYPGKRITFWLSSEVRAWQQEQMRLVLAS